MAPTSTVISYNPDTTYLNHLSPHEALEYEITRNVLIVLLGATFWDILATLSDDIKVVKHSRLRFATFCFIFSRGFALVHVTIDVICRIMPIHNLYATPLSSIIFCGLSVSCSEYIFLQRIRAIYADSPRVRRFFAIFWMVSLSSEILLLFSIKPVYIPNTQQFKDAGVQPLMCLTIVTAIAFDSSVFLAISYKIGIAHIVIDREMGWKRFITGKALPRLSQAVLRGGQQYYLLVFLVLLPTTIILYIPSIPQNCKSTLVVFLSPLVASMSCRVYRKIKLFERDVTTPYPISEIRFV